MKAFETLRFRLTCWYSAIVGLVLIASGAILYAAVRYQSIHHHDDSLRAAANAVVSILAEQPDCATLTHDQVAALGRLQRLVLVHELEGQGTIFYRSPDLDPTQVPMGDNEIRELLSRPEFYRTVEGTQTAWRIYSVRYTTRTGRMGAVRVMDALGNVAEALKILRWALILMVPLSLLVAGVGGYWLAGRALRPVDEVTRLAKEIEATNLRRRLPAPRTDDELGRLVRTINQMIGRLESAFESMRRFTADASHEIKTPLTIMRGEIDVALGRDRSSAEYRATLESLLEEVERLARVSDDLLFLALADAGSQELRREPTRLGELVTEVVEGMQPVAEAHKVSLSAPFDSTVEISGDERWLRQMLYNLVDNAIKHGGGTVRVTLEQDNGIAQLSVSDTGVGIPREERPRVFERFYRVDQSRSRRSGGAGLGLSIALWVAQSHGGDIQIESEAGAGTIFRVRLPLTTTNDRFPGSSPA